MSFQNTGMTNPHSDGMMHPLFITSGKQKHFCSFNKSSKARQFGKIYELEEEGINLGHLCVRQA